MKTHFSRSITFISIAWLACSHHAHAATYSLKILDSLGGSIAAANAINDVGQIVGVASTPDDINSHAVLWSDTNVSDLGTLGGSHSVAYDINNAGQIVGIADNGGAGHARAALWQDGKVIDLGTLGGSLSYAYAINNAGQIVGSAYKQNFDSHATLWVDGIITDLGTLGGDYSTAQSINNSGQIVGTSYTLNNALQRATQWQGTSMRELNAPDASWSGGHAINDSGVVLGRLDGNPILWNGDSIVQLGTLGGTSNNVYSVNTLAWSINNDQIVVGFSHTTEHAQHATLWDGTGILDLNQFLTTDEINAGWELIEARDINNFGIIVGTAFNNLSNTKHAFVLTPTSVPEPSTLTLLIFGLLGTAIMKKHRA